MTRSSTLHSPPEVRPGSAGRLRRWLDRAAVRAQLLRRRVSGLPAVPGWLLVATVAFAAPLDQLYPAAGLDPSWQAGLNFARQRQLRFGPDLVFTYGPWGFLDHPEAVSRFNLVAGTLFTIAAVGVAWLAVWAALRARLGRPGAALAASLLVTLCALTILPSALLFAGMMLALLIFVDRPLPHSLRWIPAAAAGCAALLVQIKFSEGAVLAVAALCAAAFAGARRWRRLAEAALALVLGTLLCWLLARQPLTAFPGWLREMRQVVGGYTDAMSLEARPNVLPYLLIAAITGLAVGYLVRLARDRPARVTAAVAVLVLLVLYLGFREGTGRHGPGMQKYFYMYSLPVLVWAVSASRRIAFRLGAVGLVVLLAGSSWLPLSPSDAVTRWGNQLQLMVDSGYQADQLQHAKLVARQHYALSGQMQAAVTGPPVVVDPWESTLAWAYDLNWKPVPAFQTYVAYTGKLDELNASALAQAGPDQLILRQAGLNSIDGRNRLWDPPRYLLTELCDYRQVLGDARWLLLGKAEIDRCGPPQQLASQRVLAGQQVTVPITAADSLLIMSFRPSSPGLAVRLGRLLDKSFHPLRVTADGTGYRLPRQLADGPLIVQLPLATGWPAAFGGGISYRTVSFSEPGEVSFSIVPLH
jgi:hypothetical protein